ncbi:MAG: [acyl-carrier-protein] S-malonyltransferase [Omnitrophica bacterium RIFCSPHIGHO2_02_FULL_46_11]|nr:MAG: [acyl-carrier-protein] S-malonyltransferase [Omnitrophica bacterium RIFCSPHIGHO2_02_FULL_46_11]
MKPIGFLFPGQGAQSVGMGADFYRESPEARTLFDKADRLLGFSFTKLCFEGPEHDLTRTMNAQIAIFVTSLAVLTSIRADHPELKPALACGLSLGEFTALVALESISFEEGLELVRKRGELMEEANQKNPGTMASILGFPIKDCEAVCQETGAEIANLNSYEQIVISGPLTAVNSACELAKSKGAKRVIPLKVGGAFHSSLMSHARSGLGAALSKTQIKEPKGVFIPNVSGKPVSKPEEIRKLLSEQLTNPVQWIKTMESISQSGPKDLLEIGPGRVLKGLARKINPELNVVSIEKIADLEQLKPILVS